MNYCRVGDEIREVGSFKDLFRFERRGKTLLLSDDNWWNDECRDGYRIVRVFSLEEE